MNQWVLSSSGVWINLDHVSMAYVLECPEKETGKFEVRLHVPQQNGHIAIREYDEKEKAQKCLNSIVGG